MCYLSVLEERAWQTSLDEQTDNFELLNVDEAKICDLELWNDRKGHEGQCHERIIQRTARYVAHDLSQFIQTGRDLRYGKVGHETSIWERERTGHLSIVRHCKAAADEGNLLHCQQHVPVCHAAHNDVVGIVGDRRGQRSLFHWSR